MRTMIADDPGRRSVLITGAAGRVGRLLTRAWKDRYRLSLLDIRPLDADTDLPFMQADAASLQAMRLACAGVDTVVHLAGLPIPLTEWRVLRHHNVRSTWAVLKAAAASGCRRVVFASTVTIDLNPTLPYSRAKRLGERLGARYAERHPPSVLCLRLGHVFATQERGLWPDARFLPYAVHEDDTIEGFTRAIETASALRYGVFTVISANRHPYVDIIETRNALGYEPRMDSFALADARHRSWWGQLRKIKVAGRQIAARLRTGPA